MKILVNKDIEKIGIDIANKVIVHINDDKIRFSFDRRVLELYRADIADKFEGISQRLEGYFGERLPEPVTSIDWSLAPKWANYAAQDMDGAWHWFRHRPIFDYNAWTQNSPVGTRNKAEYISVAPDCENSLQQRP